MIPRLLGTLYHHCNVNLTVACIPSSSHSHSNFSCRYFAHVPHSTLIFATCNDIPHNDTACFQTRSVQTGVTAYYNHYIQSFRTFIFSLSVNDCTCRFVSFEKVSRVVFFSDRRAWRSALTACFRAFFSSAVSSLGRAIVTRTAVKVSAQSPKPAADDIRLDSSSSSVPEESDCGCLRAGLSSMTEGSPVLGSSRIFGTGLLLRALITRG